jgi:hypothetical protein
MKSGSLTKKFFIAALLALALTITPSISAQMQTSDRSADKNDDKGGYGFTTGVVGIVEGQTARLTLWNKGDKPVVVRIQFVDTEGKVLIQCNEIIEPGKTHVDDFDWPCCGGNARFEFRAQYGTAELRSIGLLVPTLQITDGTSNANAWMIGPEGFVEFRSITFGGAF